MRRALWHSGRLRLDGYPVMLYLGLCLGMGAGNAAARAAGIDPFRAWIATLILLPPAFLGARLLYVATHWQVYRRDPRRIWNGSGGAAMYGGLALAVIAGWPTLRLLDLDIGGFADSAIFTILVGMIFARAGCLLNGCCTGRVSQSVLALSLPDVRGVRRPRVPAPFLEMGCAVALLAGAVALWPSLQARGALFCWVAAAYGAARVVLQWAREPEQRFGHWFNSALWLLLVSGSVLVLTRITAGHPPPPTYEAASWYLLATPLVTFGLVTLPSFVGCDDVPPEDENGELSFVYSGIPIQRVRFRIRRDPMTTTEDRIEVQHGDDEDHLTAYPYAGSPVFFVADRSDWLGVFFFLAPPGDWRVWCDAFRAEDTDKPSYPYFDEGRPALTRLPPKHRFDFGVNVITNKVEPNFAFGQTTLAARVFLSLKYTKVLAKISAVEFTLAIGSPVTSTLKVTPGNLNTRLVFDDSSFFTPTMAMHNDAANTGEWRATIDNARPGNWTVSYRALREPGGAIAFEGSLTKPVNAGEPVIDTYFDFVH